MNIIQFAILMALSCLLRIGNAAVSSSSDPTPEIHVYASGDSLVVRDTLLLHQVIEQAIDLLDAHPKIRKLWLVNVPGGYAVPSARLAWRAQELDVTVGGACFSACADVALSGRTLRMRPRTDDRSTALVIHGQFDLAGNWSSSGLNQLLRYAERLAPIPQADIEEALRYPYPSAAGLFIFSDRSFPKAGGRIAVLCPFFPSKCKDLEVTLAQLHIGTTDDPVPEAPVDGSAAPLPTSSP